MFQINYDGQQNSTFSIMKWVPSNFLISSFLVRVFFQVADKVIGKFLYVARTLAEPVVPVLIGNPKLHLAFPESSPMSSTYWLQ